jgi:transcriptional regulator with GAF, ATPase, and Fis domain
MAGPMKTATTRVKLDGDRPRLFRRKFTLQVLEGPDRGSSLTSAKDTVTVGSSPKNDLVLADAAVSRHHLRVEATPRGFMLSDLDSTNGTTVGTLQLQQALAHGPVELRIGESTLRFTPLAEEEEVLIPATDHYGPVLGRSPAMRELFCQLEMIAGKDVTVLLEGETGTGKELIAEAIHEHSPRRKGPFVVVDCGAIPSNLIESELFGHLRGSFTGAVSDRCGAFEEAEGGTVLLDEVSELDLPLQPRLLRMLEQRQVKRLGEPRFRKVDVRVIAATNRDLQRQVNQGTFRSDLYYRLAVMHLRIPPLRHRPEDVELLVQRLLPEIATRLGLPGPPELDGETMQQLIGHPWPGNVRELRNFLERVVTLSHSRVSFTAPEELGPVPPAEGMTLDELEHLPFREAKARWTEAFDVAYLQRLLARCNQNVAEAARQSGIDRVHLFRLVKKYNLRG